ncbi:hypothetical protein NE237_014134 [Protea cynaroides]|uniref:F-box domain-containing protein n=1 Tax=Protea cynaroides TaxID=273540 RepID=A0A9Q0GZY4_9MAGN|nr:hypothetical protein NE237_014134 [Protea cynaroides]
MADILSRTSPRDACRLSVVSTIFRSVADSDSVWERFLPSDIQSILSTSVSSSLSNFSSKKELFLHLSDNPVLINNGTRTFGLEKCSGKKCYMVGAKELPRVPEPRPSRVVAIVISTSGWHEVRGKMETRLLSPNTTYVAYLVFNFTEPAYVYSHVKASIKLASGGRPEQGEVKKINLMVP